MSLEQTETATPGVLPTTEATPSTPYAEIVVPLHVFSHYMNSCLDRIAKRSELSLSEGTDTRRDRPLSEWVETFEEELHAQVTQDLRVGVPWLRVARQDSTPSDAPSDVDHSLQMLTEFGISLLAQGSSEHVWDVAHNIKLERTRKALLGACHRICPTCRDTPSLPTSNPCITSSQKGTPCLRAILTETS